MTATERVLEGDGRLDVVRYSGKDDPSKMGWLELALAGAAFKSYYLYIYGLFRTDLLRRAFANLPQLAAADLLFFIQLAMATRLRYVDELWSVRQVAARRLELRYAGEADASIWSNPFGVWLVIIRAGPYLFKSPLIPWQRKLLIPLIVARLVTPRRLYIGLYGSLSHWAERKLGPQRHLAIRRRLRRVAGLPPL